MADGAERARARGDLPHAPAWTGAGVALGGGLGAAVGGVAVPWRALLRAGVVGDQAVWELARQALAVGVGGALAGAVGGLVGAQITLGAWAPRWRRRLRPGPAPRRTGVLALGGGLLAALALPLALRGGHDPGRLLVAAWVAGFGLGAAGVALAAAVDRGRARAAWRERTKPVNPRRDPDEAAPEARAAVSARGREAGPTADP